ncbi:MAG: hypothetical protein L6R41_000704 [Letrouitia leprolyta]|nr:MAG: hypothetical protein L6R41_000704 [Letrouitia leprolyta]
MGLHQDQAYIHQAYSRPVKRLKDMKSQTLSHVSPVGDLDGQGTQHSPVDEQKFEDYSYDPSSPTFSKMIPKRKRREKYRQQGTRAGSSHASDMTSANVQPRLPLETTENKHLAKKSCSKNGVIDLASDDEDCPISVDIKKEQYQTLQLSGEYTLPSDVPSMEASQSDPHLHQDTLMEHETRISELEATVRRLCEKYDLTEDAKDTSHVVHSSLEPQHLPLVNRKATADSVEHRIKTMGVIPLIDEKAAEPLPCTTAIGNLFSAQPPSGKESFGQVDVVRKAFIAVMEKIDQDHCLPPKEKEDLKLRWEDKFRRLLTKHQLEILDLTEDFEADLGQKTQEYGEGDHGAHSREPILPDRPVAAGCDQENPDAVIVNHGARDASNQQSSQAVDGSEDRKSEDRSGNSSQYLSFDE